MHNDEELSLGFHRIREVIPRREHVLRGYGSEAQEIKRRLADFQYRQSPVFSIIRQIFPTAVNGELVGIAQTIIYVARLRGFRYPDDFVKFDRVTRRSLDLIIKWYHDYWAIIYTILPDIGLADARFATISNCGQ
jgi:hypothetical protein